MKFIFLLITALSIPLISIYLVPPSKVKAQCYTGEIFSIKVTNGLISAKEVDSFKAGDNVYCVSGNSARFSDTSTYPLMKTTYYDHAPRSLEDKKQDLKGDRTQNDITISASKQLFWIARSTPTAQDGNLTLSGNISVGNGLIAVIFVDGDLYIKANQTYTPATAGSKAGLVFVVQGAIWIENSVTEVNAYMVAYGKKKEGSGNVVDTSQIFCTAWDGDKITLGCSGTNSDPELKINGSVIALNENLDPNFARTNSSASYDKKALETITYQPKYLVVFKDTFSRDLKVWKEIQ